MWDSESVRVEVCSPRHLVPSSQLIHSVKCIPLQLVPPPINISSSLVPFVNRLLQHYGITVGKLPLPCCRRWNQLGWQPVSAKTYTVQRSVFQYYDLKFDRVPCLRGLYLSRKPKLLYRVFYLLSIELVPPNSVKKVHQRWQKSRVIKVKVHVIVCQTFPTEPNSKGDQKYSERRSKGDLILSKKGT